MTPRSHLSRIHSHRSRESSMHKMRSFLTMLGIIFGVGAVIAMLSIGEGAARNRWTRSRCSACATSSAPFPPTTISLMKRARRRGGGHHEERRAGGQRDLLLRRQHRRLLGNPDRSEDVRSSIKATLVGTEPSYASIFNVKMNEGSSASPPPAKHGTSASSAMKSRRRSSASETSLSARETAGPVVHRCGVMQPKRSAKQIDENFPRRIR